MNKKQYRRLMEYREGYKRGYHVRKTLLPGDRVRKSPEYMRGFYAGRKDYRAGEAPEI